MKATVFLVLLTLGVMAEERFNPLQLSRDEFTRWVDGLSGAAEKAAPTRDLRNRPARLRLADTILAEVEAINDSIPHLTPEQEDWRRKEADRIERLDANADNYVVNVSNFLMSKEWRIWRAKACLDPLIRILRLVGDAEKGEVSLWATILESLTDCAAFDCVESLAKEGHIKLSRPSSAVYLVSGRTAHAEDILKRVIRPYVAKAEGLDVRFSEDGAIVELKIPPRAKPEHNGAEK